MHSKSVSRKLHEIVNEMLKREPDPSADLDEPPFALESPVKHKSKSEFNREFEAVVEAGKHAKGLVNCFVKENMSEAEISMFGTVKTYVDANSKKHASPFEGDSASELVAKNAVDVGLFLSTINVVLEFHSALYSREYELHDEKEEFWSQKNRPPNYRARIIALRLARLLAQETGIRPTYGTSRDGGHPSTDYSHALEKVFKVLEIDAGIRGPAEWAIAQITDHELHRVFNKPYGHFFNDALEIEAVAALKQPQKDVKKGSKR